jgi:hypothetical protein
MAAVSLRTLLAMLGSEFSCTLELPANGACWGRAFGEAGRVPAASPTSRAFGSRRFHPHKRNVCQVFHGSVDVEGARAEAANDRRKKAAEAVHLEARSRRPQTDQRSKAGGPGLTAERRPPHGRLHVVAPHWRIKK